MAVLRAVILLFVPSSPRRPTFVPSSPRRGAALRAAGWCDPTDLRRPPLPAPRQGPQTCGALCPTERRQSTHDYHRSVIHRANSDASRCISTRGAAQWCCAGSGSRRGTSGRGRTHALNAPLTCARRLCARSRRAGRHASRCTSCIQDYTKRVVYCCRIWKRLRDVRFENYDVRAFFQYSFVVLSANRLRVIEVVLGSHVV